MILPGIRYDSIAALVARAPRGVRQDRLDWLCEGLKAYVEHMQGRYELAEQRAAALD